jgi:hypothetical protein
MMDQVFVILGNALLVIGTYLSTNYCIQFLDGMIWNFLRAEVLVAVSDSMCCMTIAAI